MGNPYRDKDTGRFTFGPGGLGSALASGLASKVPTPKLTIKPAGEGQTRAVRAYDETGKEIARLSWSKDNTIEWITVHPEYRQRGVARELFNQVKQDVEPELAHSNQTTPLGKLFQEGMGHESKPKHFDNPPVDDAEDWPDAKIGQGERWQGKGWRTEWFKAENAKLMKQSDERQEAKRLLKQGRMDEAAEFILDRYDYLSDMERYFDKPLKRLKKARG